MKNLNLSIKEIYFNQILSGEKKSEFREIRHNNVSRYCQVDQNGEVIVVDGEIQTVAYDTITFYTGAYVGKRPKMVVQVEKAEAYVLEDEKGELITYEVDGVEYYAAEIEYHLGAIVEQP